MSQNYNLNNKRIVINWKKIFKKNFIFFKFKKNEEYQIFYDFLKTIKIKKNDDFKFPNKKIFLEKLNFGILKEYFIFTI